MEYENEYGFSSSYLMSGEYVLWRGRPGKGKIFNKSDVYMIPFSLFWCGFAFFWEWSVIQNGISLFALFGIPFVCVGIYLVIGRFFHLAWLRKRTYYVITNFKIIRKQGKNVDVLMGKNMPSFSVVHYENGYGSIRFAQANYHDRSSRAAWVMDKSGFSLENIPDVTRVQQILTQISSQ